MEDLTKDPAVVEISISPKGWKTPPLLKDLKQDLTDATTASENQKTKIDGWLDNLHVTGSAVPKTPKGSSSVQPKLIRKQAEWRYAALSEPFLAAEDLFDIQPVTWEDVESARQNKLLINNQINTKLDKVQFIDSYIRAAVDEGTIIVRLGWENIEEIEEVEKPIIEYQPNPEMAEVFQQIGQLKQENPTGYEYEVPEELKEAFEMSQEAGVPLEPNIIDFEMVEEPKTVKNAPTLEVCDYRNITIDPSCQGNFEKAQFVIYSFETSLSELRKENRYENLDEINAEANSPLSDPDHESAGVRGDFNFSDDARKRIIAYEYWGFWDYDGSGIAKPFVSTWVGNTQIRLEESPYPDKKLPFVVVPMLPVRNSVYGEPDGALLIENQKIIGAVTRGMIDVMGKSANGQMGMRKDALDATNRRKFQLGKDYEYNAGVDPRMGFYMHTYPEIPQSAGLMLQMQNQDAEAMSGVKGFASGISSDGLGEVATGIRGALDAASKRETGILRRLAQGMQEIGRKIISMNAEFLDDKEIIRITNENFIAIRRDELAGNFDLRVDVSSLEEDNVKAQELSFMLQTMGPNGDQMITMKILTKIAQLRKMPDLANEFRNYQPEPDPMQEQLQQLEMAKLQAEIAKIESETQENGANAQLDMAKAGTEQAKARQMSSQSDLSDLDFVEQESGVKQEREKELYGEQARSNALLEDKKHQNKLTEKRTDAIAKYMAGKNTSK